MSLEQIKKELLHKKELRAKARGRLDQLLDTLQKEFGVRSLVEARGMKVDLEKELAKRLEANRKRESALEKKVNAFFGKDKPED